MVATSAAPARFLARLGCALLLLATAASTRAQASGFNFTIAYDHSLVQHEVADATGSVALGLAYQQDLGPRFGVALDGVFGIDQTSGIRSYEGIYSAKYFFTENEGTTVYMGSFIGIQSIKAEVTDFSVRGPNGFSTTRKVEASKLQVPIGIRAGLRGGLDGYFGELYIQAGYAIGNGDLYVANDAVVKTNPLYFCMGFSFLGFGWDH